MGTELHILIVEDSPTQAMLLKHFLEQNGYRASVAKNGKAGLDFVMNQKPDLVISDIVMPEMDGYEMCRMIKNNVSLKDIPVILLTVLSDSEDVIKGLEANAEAYVTKPFNKDHLLLKVKSILETPVHQEDNGDLEVKIGKKSYVISSNRQQILNLLLFTYESAVQQNRELIKMQGELKQLNEQLEEKVEERTAELKEEITERKRIEKSLKRANERLKELDVLKSDFLSTVSHELRTPLAIMREGVSLCLEGIAGEITNTQDELLVNVQDNIDRLTRLIADLLDISKIEAKKVKLWRRSVNLCDVIKKVQHSFHQQVTKKGIHIEIDIPESPVVLYIDADKVTQIFNNLVSNAMRFTENGKIVLCLEEKEEEVEFRVSDTGIGIAEDDIPKLFSKFEQIGRIEGPGYKGTGLGLAIVKGLVEKHGGTIGVESKIGEGTTFWFTLEKVPFPKILIIDDDKNIIEEIRHLLNKEGYFFVEAYDGIKGVELALAEDPALVILDMVLPGMNGYEIIGRLKQDKRTQHIPILILSAFSVDAERLSQLDDHSAIPVQKKPFDPQIFVDHVRELITE